MQLISRALLDSERGCGTVCLTQLMNLQGMEGGRVIAAAARPFRLRVSPIEWELRLLCLLRQSLHTLSCWPALIAAWIAASPAQHHGLSASCRSQRLVLLLQSHAAQKVEAMAMAMVTANPAQP